MMWFDQGDYDVKFEWGLRGANALAVSSPDATGRIVIVVDILSFSSCVEAAVSRGASVYPYLFKDARAEEHAASVGAKLASTQRSKTEICLSPPSLLKLMAGDKIVLPSPNGSTICFSLPANVVCIAGGFRNAAAVAEFAMARGREIIVIAAGERWPAESAPPSDELRPSLEDMIGAGAILSHLSELLGSAARGRASSLSGPSWDSGPVSFSPEAESAIAVFKKFESRLLPTLLACGSGRELVERGFPEDVEYAAELNVSRVVPVLRDRVFAAR